jgi:hypothetical protein
MSRSGVLAKGQVKAEASMVDACTIRRRLPDVTNTDLSPDPYTGKCRVQSALARSQPHESGEDYVLLLRLELQLPVSVTGLRVDDEVTVTASAHDADLVGRVFLIRDLFHKTEPTARRVEITERTNS